MCCLLACSQKDEVVPTLSPTPEYVRSDELRAFERRLSGRGFTEQQQREIAAIVAESLEQHISTPATPVVDGGIPLFTDPIEHALSEGGYTPEEIRAIVELIRAAGYVNPYNLDQTNTIVPTIDVTRLVQTQVKLVVETEVAELVADGTRIHDEARATVETEVIQTAEAVQEAICIISNAKYHSVAIREAASYYQKLWIRKKEKGSVSSQVFKPKRGQEAPRRIR